MANAQPAKRREGASWLAAQKDRPANQRALQSACAMPPSTQSQASVPVLLDPLEALPLFLSRRVFTLLPVDSRAKASCVSRSWRDALVDPALWERLDLSHESGVAEALLGGVQRRNADALLSAAADRARGQLRCLDVTGVTVTTRALLDVLAANAGSMRTLHVSGFDEPRLSTLDAIVAAAPTLQAVEVLHVSCCCDKAPRLIRSAVLRLTEELFVNCDPNKDGPGDLARVGPVAEALSDATLQPALKCVHVSGADLAQPEVMKAIVDTAVMRPLRGLSFTDCTPPHATSLARLLEDGAVTKLGFHRLRGTELFDAARAALVGEALRINTTLTKLTLETSHLFDNARAAEILLGALVLHPSLRVLVVACEDGSSPEARGTLLAALIAADAPALLYFCVYGNSSPGHTSQLGDAGLGPLIDALPRNRHLFMLAVPCNGMSEHFARHRLLPAVRSNTGLRVLDVLYLADGDRISAAKEAEDLVASRPGAPPRS